jgi:tetratricopeptide (TPR) repeat protein
MKEARIVKRAAVVSILLLPVLFYTGCKTTKAQKIPIELPVVTEDAAAYYGRGGVYFDLGRYDEALHELNKSLELDPNDKDAYEGRGEIYTKLAESSVDENKRNEYLQKAEDDFETSRAINDGL